MSALVVKRQLTVNIMSAAIALVELISFRSSLFSREARGGCCSELNPASVFG